MGKLSASDRNHIKGSNFLIPSERALPVNDRGHWQAARGRLSNYPGQEKALIAKWERIGRKRGWLKKKPEDGSQQLSDSDEMYENDTHYEDYFQGGSPDPFFVIWDDRYGL